MLLPKHSLPYMIVVSTEISLQMSSVMSNIMTITSHDIG